MNCSGQRGDLRNWEGEEERRKGENGSAIGSHGHLDEEVIRSRKRRRGELPSRRQMDKKNTEREGAGAIPYGSAMQNRVCKKRGVPLERRLRSGLRKIQTASDDWRRRFLRRTSANFEEDVGVCRRRRCN